MSVVPRGAIAHPYVLRPEYLDPVRFRAQQREDVLGAALFGESSGGDTQGLIPIPLSPIGVPALIECWRGREPVMRGCEDNVQYAHDGIVLFASIVCDERGGIEQVAEEVYVRLLALAERLGYRHVLRAWNHFPRIHEDENGLERYRRFNIGRHRAFAPRLATGWLRPAATVIGTHAPGFHVYLLAAVHPGALVDNPRQTPPFHYPPQYGPQPPDFSRAVIARLGGARHLFVSGTAAILGHTSQSPKNADGQIEEALANLMAVLRSGGVTGASADTTAVKVYIAGPEPERTAARVAARSQGLAPVYLRGDVCRAELVVEFEATAAPLPAAEPVVEPN
ncbi:MAG: chorismate transformation enzyme, FkbO/Hyg5 family [Acidiferrobacteraceae bacterium]